MSALLRVAVFCLITYASVYMVLANDNCPPVYEQTQDEAYTLLGARREEYLIFCTDLRVSARQLFDLLIIV